MGQVRIPVTIDKAEEAIRELRSIAGGIKNVGDTSKRSADALDQIGRAFTPMRRNLETINQLRGAFNTLAIPIQMTVGALRALIEASDGSRNAMNGIEVATGGMARQFAEGFDRGLQLTEQLNSMADALNRVAPAAEVAGRALAFTLEVAVRTAGMMTSVSGMPLLGSAISLASSANDVAGVMPRRGDVAALSGELGMDTGLTDETAGWLAVNEAAGEAAASAARYRQTRPGSRGGGGGGDSASAALTEEASRWQAMKDGAMAEVERVITEQYREQVVALREQFANLDAIAALEQRRYDSATLALEVERETAAKTKDQLTQQMEIEQELADQREERTQTLIGGMQSIAGAAMGLGKAVTSAYEAMGGSSEKAKKVEGAFVVAYSSVMAALELAESIRAFAKQDYVSGALHLIGMAAYIAAAVEAGSQLGGGAAKTPSAQTSYTPARTEGLAAESGEQQGNTIVNQYSWGRSRAEAAVAVADIEYEGARTGRVRGADAGVWGA